MNKQLSNQIFPYIRSIHPGSAVPFEKVSQRWRAVGSTVFNLTGPRFELQTSRSRDERYIFLFYVYQADLARKERRILRVKLPSAQYRPAHSVQ